MEVGLRGSRREVGSAVSSSSIDCTHAMRSISVHSVHTSNGDVVRGRVRTARCLSLLSAERLPFDDARVCGFEDTECECDFLTAAPSSWSLCDLLGLVEEVAEAPESGR